MTSAIGLKFPPLLADAHAGTRHVFVRDLVVITAIGVHDAEKRAPQRIIVNVDLVVAETGRTTSDRLEDVVDYSAVVRRIEQICGQGHVNLVETLAERTADGCLADPRIRAVRVRIEKPDVIANARSVGIEIERLQTQPLR
jgi:dihydroneopterin aldolase